MVKYFICLALLTSGCVSAIPLSNEEQCAGEDMMPHSVSIGRSRDSAFVTNGKHGATVVSNGSSRSVNCIPAPAPVEQCRVEAAKVSLHAKEDFNSGVGTKRLLTGLGYWLYIVPGVALNYIYEKQRAEAISFGREGADHVINKCMPDENSVRMPTNEMPNK